MQVVVVGATGLQGSQVSYMLENSGHSVIGLTRDPNTEKARKLKSDGITLVQADLDKPESIGPAFANADAVFMALDSAQKIPETEYRQGRTVIEAAASSGRSIHFIYSSVAAAGADNGVRHFGIKNRLEQTLRETTLQWTILRPTAFMEGLVEKKFVPPVLWHVWSKVTGWDTPIQWIAVSDIVRSVVAILEDPTRYHEQSYDLTGDKRSLRQAYQAISEKLGSEPKIIRMPVFLFRKLISQDLYNLFAWYREDGFNADSQHARSLLVQPLTFETWLEERTANNP